MKVFQIYELCSLLRTQWINFQRLKSIQEKKLRKLIHHAYHHVPYYRELFDSQKLKPTDIQTREDLILLPVTSRQTLRDLPVKEKTADNIDISQCKHSATSGTTGIPLKVYKTPHDSTLMGFAWARSFLSAGMKPWYKIAAFVGQSHIKKKKSWYEYLGLWRRQEIFAGDSPQEWIEKLRKWNPWVLVGYVMTLKMLGEAIQNYHVQDIQPKLIFHSSAILDDFSRGSLESVFQATIIDIYGSDEAGCVAWECKTCGAYHLSEDMVILEILKDGEPALPEEEGEVVITNLHSYAMPFIRYRQDDVGCFSQKKSRCGRVFPLLQSVLGRVDDFIFLKNGQKISPHTLYHCIDPIPEVRRWRITQEEMGRITLEIEPLRQFSEVTQKQIKNNIKNLAGQALEVDVIPVDSIPINHSSKFRAVISKLGKDL
jgi:phenylacetate-CoA ligase